MSKLSEEEVMQGINRTIAFMKEELKAEHSCFSIKEMWSLHGLLELYDKEKQKNKELAEENHNLKEKLQMFIPRRRVRRAYKMLGKILRTDIDPILLEEDLKKGNNKF